MQINDFITNRIYTDLQLESSAVGYFFNDLLDLTLLDRIWILVFYKFTTPPFSFWDKKFVKDILVILEADKERTQKAMSYQEEKISLFVDNFLEPRNAIFDDYGNTSGSVPFFIIRDEVNPAYLKLSEDIWNNLSDVYWSILKKRSIEGKSDAKGKIALFSKLNYKFLFSGYSDDIRNGIAHGKVKYGSIDMLYSGQRISFSELIQYRDDLWRTSINLVLALLIFLAKNKNIHLPRGFAYLKMIEDLKKEDIRIQSIADANLWTVGNQINIKASTKFSAKSMLLGIAIKIAGLVVIYTKDFFDRIVIELDTGRNVTSMLMLSVRDLTNCIELDSDLDSEEAKKIFEDLQLLWYKGSYRKDKWLVFKNSIRGAYQIGKFTMQKGFQPPARSLYSVKYVENFSSSGVCRIKILLSVKPGVPVVSLNRDFLNSIIFDSIQVYKKKFFKVNISDLDKKALFRKRPSCIIVNVYASEGTKSWMGKNGWLGGNLIGIGEWKSNKNFPYILVKDPQYEFNNINIRYEINKKAFKKAFEEVEKKASEVIQEVLDQRQEKV